MENIYFLLIENKNLVFLTHLREMENIYFLLIENINLVF